MSAIDRELPRAEREARALNQTFAVVEYGPDSRIRNANYQFLRLLGYDLEEIIGSTAEAFICDTTVRSLQAEAQAKLAAGEKVERCTLWTGKLGREVWLRTLLTPIFDEAQALIGIIQIAEDVTERMCREAEDHSQIKAIQTSQAVVHFAIDGTILWANDIFLEVAGYTREQLIGQHHSLLVDAKYRSGEEHGAFWARLVKGDHHQGEFHRIRRDGSDLWLQAVYSPILDQLGRVTKIAAYATDITTEKVRQADHEWQLIAIHKSNCVITFDMHGTILDANDLFLEATGYTLDQIQGRHHKMFLEPSHAYSSEYMSFWTDLRAGKHRAGQFKRYAADGREMWLQATYNPIFDATGRPVKVVKFASIVTNERLLRAEHQGQIAAINHSQCVVTFDIDGTILDANDNFLDATGYRFADVRGRHHRMFVWEAERESEAYATFWKKLAAGNHCGGECRRVGRDGKELWFQATYNPIRDMDGQVFRVVEYATDISGDKVRQADLHGQIEAINKSQGVVVFGLDGTIVDANSNFLDTVGYARVELVGKAHVMLVDRATAASDEYADFWKSLRAGQYRSGLYKRIGKGGQELWLQASYNPICDPNGVPYKVVKYATDVSSNVALAEAFEEAKRQAQLDAATSLPNRAKLSSFMNASLADPSASLAVLYIDLDDFKPINDTYGHHIGDRVLGEVADRLRRLLREDQIVARVGADEFVIAAPGLTLADIERLCSTLYQKIAEPIRHDEGEIVVGLSIGIAMAPTDAGTADDLLRAADAALCRSKQNGRGTHSYYCGDLTEKVRGQRQLLDEMRNSYTSGDFFLEYQPRFDTRTRAIRSVEALVRWAHPERGRVNPAEFIPLAERCGFIVPLGDWILRTACQTAKRWDGLGVSVNVSPVQFRDDDLVEKVSVVLDESGLPPDLLELEITEGVLLDDTERAIAVLTRLKDLGVRLAVDDFGTGYSSLSYLSTLPFDVIKIDQSFIRDLDGHQGARPIVQAIIGLGHALGLSVTAEGVETNEQLLLLTHDRCNEVQGYLLARPLGIEQIDLLLAGEDGTGDETRDRSAA